MLYFTRSPDGPITRSFVYVFLRLQPLHQPIERRLIDIRRVGCCDLHFFQCSVVIALRYGEAGGVGVRDPFVWISLHVHPEELESFVLLALELKLAGIRM